MASALAGLGAFDQLEPAEYPDTYQRIHADLQRALAEIDDA